MLERVLEIELDVLPRVRAVRVDEPQGRTIEAEAPADIVGDTVAHGIPPYTRRLASPCRHDHRRNGAAIALEHAEHRLR
jgi:hypothetical protein